MQPELPSKRHDERQQKKRPEAPSEPEAIEDTVEISEEALRELERLKNEESEKGGQ